MTTIPYTPIRDGLIALAPVKEDKIAGGLLYKPETVEDNIVSVKLLAVGTGRLTQNGVVPLEVQVGDTVLINRRSALDLKAPDGKLYLQFREDQVLTKVNV